MNILTLSTRALPFLRSPVWHRSPATATRFAVSSRCSSHRTRRRPVSEEKKNKAKKQPPRNEEIPFESVQVKDPETNRLAEPTRLSDLLASIDRETHDVQLVHRVLAVVQIMPKKDERERQREQEAKEKLARKQETKSKEVQMTWTVEEGDFKHKLEKARKELKKGSWVAVVFAPKKGIRMVSAEEMEGRLERTLTGLADVGKEWKEREITKGVAILHIQPLDGSRNTS